MSATVGRHDARWAPHSAVPVTLVLARVPLGLVLALWAVLIPGEAARFADIPLRWADLRPARGEDRRARAGLVGGGIAAPDGA